MLDGQLAVVSRYEALDGTWPSTADKALVTAGRVLAVDWATRLSAGGNATWAQITSGTYDTQITAQANYLAAWGQPVFVGLCNEFDGGVNITKSGPLTDYAAYYRHVHGIVAPLAPNVIWCWCVTSSNDNTATAAAFPGTSYVDWLFADPYDATLSKGSPVTNPTATYSPWVTWVTAQSFYDGQPLGIFETGVDNSVDDATEATWIDNIPGVMAALGIQCWIWFNSSGSLGNTSITPGSLSAAALANIGLSPVFNPSTTQAGAAALAGAGTMGAAAVRERAPATLAGAGMLAAAATIPAGSGGAGTLAGAGSVGAAAVQAPVSLMGGAGVMTVAGLTPLGTPYVIATGTASTAVATQAAAVTATSGAGDCILVGCSVNSASESPSSVADTKNAYAKIASQGADIENAIFAAYNTTSLVSGTDTITGTFSSATGNAKNVFAIGIPGVAAALAFDQGASGASSASTAPGASLAALSQAAEIVLAWADYASGGGTIAWTAPLTQVGSVLELLSNQKSAWASADTTAVTAAAYGGTITSAKWAFLVVSLRAAVTSQAGAALAGAGTAGGAALQRAAGAATMAGAGTLGPPAVTEQPGGAGWSFAVSGTPVTDGYFILATGQSTSVTVGDYFTDTAGQLPGGCVVTSLSAPVGGFVNVFFTPPATSALNSGDTCFQVRMAGLLAGTGALGAPSAQQAPAVLAGGGALTAGQAVTGPIGVPYAIGSASVQATTAGLEIPVGTSTGQGDAIIVGASVNSLTEWPVACEDTQGNFYVPAAANFTSYDGAVFVAVAGPPAIPGGSPGIGQTQPLVSGTDLITVTYNAADTSCMNGLAIGCPGLPENAVIDVALAGAGTGASPSLASGALAQNSELVVAFADNQTGGGIMTWAAPFAAGVLISDVFTLFNQISSISAIVADSAAPVTAAGALGASSKWDMLVVSVEGAGILAGAASLAGAGALSGAVTARSPATMAGTGTVAGAAVQSPVSLLAGTGAMTAPLVQRPVSVLAGAGTLGPVTAQQAVSAAASLAGAGTLGPAPVREGAPALMAGAGAVTAPAVQQPVSLLAGAGALAAAQTQSPVTLMAGAGTVTGAVVVQLAAAALAGAGTMGAAGTATAPSGAMLPGAGSFAAPVTQAVTAALAGAGSMGAAAAAAAPAVMAGAGTLGPAPAVQQAPALLAGAGVMAGAAAQTAHGAALLAGAGTAGGAAALAAPALLAGAGTLTALAGQSPLALIAGAGALGAVAVQIAHGSAVMAGSGALSGTAASSVTAAAVMPGAGTLGGAAVAQAPATAAGAGVMAGAATQAAHGIALLPGAGTLAAAVMQAAGAVLAGTSAMLAASAQDSASVLAGAGVMAGAAVTAATALLAGSGVLGPPVSALAAPALLAGTGFLTALAAQESGALLAGTGTLAGITAVFTVLLSAVVAGALVQEITAGGIIAEIQAGALT